jgi:hypothetical protein
LKALIATLALAAASPFAAAVEGSYTAFINGPFLSGLTNPASTGAIVHTVMTEAQMHEVMGLARQHGLGAIYVTDGTMASGNPYLHLPGYWQAEVLAAAVPEPASVLLMIAGLGSLAALRRRGAARGAGATRLAAVARVPPA